MPFLWEYFDDTTQQFFMSLRTPEIGETLILEQNVFIENVLPASIIRNLTEEEMDAYRLPYLEPGEARRPMLTWPREVPFNGTPADVTEIIDKYSMWMAENNIPKLFINAYPGQILTGIPREFARTCKNQTEVTVAGIHFLQEDSPQEIVIAINSWLDVLYSYEEGAQNSTSHASMHLLPSALYTLMFVLSVARAII